MVIKKVKRVNHIFNYSIAAVAIAGTICFYCYEKSGLLLIPAFLSLGGVVFGFVTGLVAVQGKRKMIYMNFVIQMIFLSSSFLSIGVISAFKINI